MDMQSKAFSDYLYERTNSLLMHLRETNHKYQRYLREIVVLSQELEHTQYDSEEFRTFLTRYIELKDLVGDIENVYLFTKGLAEYNEIKEYMNGEDVITDIFFPNNE